jgi:uncharacterized YccA/Bax inhibitor family protein
MMRTANPTLNAGTFTGYARPYGTTEVMTIGGTVNKTGLLLLFCLLPAAWVWRKFFAPMIPPSFIPT